MDRVSNMAAFPSLLLQISVLFIMGCELVVGIEDTTVVSSDAGNSFVVRGSAAGVLAPVSLRLDYGDGNELLSVVEDGPFAFPVELQEQDLYMVDFVDESSCVLEESSGVIANSDAEIELVCEGVFLSDLVLSGPTAPELETDPATTKYEADVSLIQNYASITAVPTSPDASITVEGVALESGAASAPIAIEPEATDIEFAVTGPGGGARGYQLTVRRTVDIAQAVYGKASNTGVGDRFGAHVALSGDTLAISAYEEDSAATGIDGDHADNTAENSGAVYVFRRTGMTWAQEAYIKASNTGANDAFGFSIALSGDTLAVGAFLEDSGAKGIDGDQDNGSSGNSGAVYVFRRTGTTWAQEEYIKASNAGAGDRFGHGVALSGDTLAVGAILEDGAGEDDSGAVYVFRRNGTSWAQEAYLKASNPGFYDDFGHYVALSDDTLIVGALHEDGSATGIDGLDDDAAERSGAVYVFRRTGTNWAQEAYIKASNTGADDDFGISLAISGDTLAVGAHTEDSKATGIDGDQGDDDGFLDSGAVYIFRRTGTTWAQEAYLKASNSEAGDHFGSSLALSGNTLVVGAQDEDSGSTGFNSDQDNNIASDSGAVYIFQRTAAGWIQNGYLKASTPGFEDRFGDSVALSGDTLVVGTKNEDSNATGINGNQNDNTAGGSGAVYIFH